MSCENQIYTFAIPGPAGAAGAAGTNGTDGISAVTTVAVMAPPVVMPFPVQRFTGGTTNTSTTVTFADTSTLAAGMFVTGTGIPSGSTVVSVDSGTDITISAAATATGSATCTFTQPVTITTTTDTAWIVSGMTLIVYSWGYMTVVAVPSSTSITVINPEDSALGLYDVNVAQGTLLTAGRVITASGIQGPAGAAATGALLIANDLSDLMTPATARTNLGLGTAAQATVGVTNGLLPPVDTTFTATDAVFATATGLQTKSDAAARTALGLGSAAQATIGITQNEIPLVSLAGGLVNGNVVFATASGIETKTVAATLAALGITNTSAMLLYRYQFASGTGGGAAVATTWTQIALNYEAVDTGNNGTLAAGVVTLVAGTYRYNYGATGYIVNRFQARLWNVTDAGVVADSYSLCSQADNAATSSPTLVVGQGRFTIAAAKAIQLEYWASLANPAANGLGLPSISGGTEVYAWLELIKE